MRAALAVGGASRREGPDDAEDAEAPLGRVTGATDARASPRSTSSSRRSSRTSTVKQDLFRDLDKVCRPGAILATTTSSLPVIDCAAVTSRPEDVVGMHFFNPAA